MNVNEQRRVVAGWCPDCEAVCIGGPEARCKCPDCGGPLEHIAICTDSEELWRYTDSMYESHPERGDGPTLAEEAANARAAAAALAEEEARCEDDGDGDAPDIIKELFCELFRDDDCEGCPLCREDGGTTDSDELPGEGELRVFMVTPTPFPVWVRGKDWKDAAHVLRGDIEELAIAGFSAAVKEGSVHLNAVPVSDDEDAPGIVMLEKVVRE